MRSKTTTLTLFLFPSSCTTPLVESYYRCSWYLVLILTLSDDLVHDDRLCTYDDRLFPSRKNKAPVEKKAQNFHAGKRNAT